MGTGEDVMRTWGYASGSFCLATGFLTLITCIFLLVLVKSDVSQQFKDNSVFLAVITMIVGLVAMIIGGVAIWKVYLANQLYLKVSADAAEGRIAVTKGVYAATKKPSPAGPPPPTSSTVPAAPTTSADENFL